jgi:hypothetical protein
MTEIEKGNWIERRIFEVRDPDGHIIWFGHSRQQSSLDRPRRMMSRVMPELPFDNVPAAVSIIAMYWSTASLISKAISCRSARRSNRACRLELWPNTCARETGVQP